MSAAFTPGPCCLAHGTPFISPGICPFCEVDAHDPVSAYVADYEFRGDAGDYSPNEHERALLEDAINGFIADHYGAHELLTGELREAERALRRIAKERRTPKPMREIALARADFAATTLAKARGESPHNQSNPKVVA